jgi:hypothetical protein
MGKKVSKPRGLLPAQFDPGPQSVRMGRATSTLPEPLAAAVDGSGGWKVPLMLRDELAISILARPLDDQELAALIERLKRLNDPDKPVRQLEPPVPPPSLSLEEWQDRAHARANEVTAEAQNDRFLGLWLRNQPRTWQGLRNSLREAIEAFAGHRGDSRRGKFESESGGCDWRWLFPPQPEKNDSNGRPAFAEPMHLALWSWIRHGDVSMTVHPDRLNNRQVGKRVTALRDTILGDCSEGQLRIRKSGLLQILAESFRQNSYERLKLVMAHSLERADGTRIDPRSPAKLPMAVIEPLLAGESLENAGIQANRRTHDNTDIYSRMSKISRKLRSKS